MALTNDDNPINYGTSMVIKPWGSETGYARLEGGAATLAADNFNFFEATSTGVNVQAGLGNSIALQTLQIKGPMHAHVPFPLSIIPVWIPPQRVDIPYLELAPHLAQLGIALAALSLPI